MEIRRIKVLSVDVLLVLIVSLFAVSCSNVSSKANLTFATPEGWLSSVFFSDMYDPDIPVSVFVAGENVYLNVVVQNAGGTKAPDYAIDHELLDSNGKVVAKARTSCKKQPVGKAMQIKNWHWKEASSLPVGKYLYRCVIDRAGVVDEDKSDNVYACEVEIVKQKRTLEEIERQFNEEYERISRMIMSASYNREECNRRIDENALKQIEFVKTWIELLSKSGSRKVDTGSGNYMTLRKFNKFVTVKLSNTETWLSGCREEILRQAYDSVYEFRAEKFEEVRSELVEKLAQLCLRLDAIAQRLPESELNAYIEHAQQNDRRLRQEMEQKFAKYHQQQQAWNTLISQVIAEMGKVQIQPLQQVDTSIKLPKSIRSMNHCAIHGYDYDLAQGCPGCKGNVDYGGGKTVRCNRHNVNYNSKLGCPWCAWPR